MTFIYKIFDCQIYISDLLNSRASTRVYKSNSKCNLLVSTLFFLCEATDLQILVKMKFLRIFLNLQ